MARITRPMDARRPHRNPIDARKRRSKTDRKPATPLGGRKSNRAAYTAPPVLMRTEAPAVVPQARSHRKNRRRYDVALSVPGAEVRLPAVPTFHLGWRLLSGVLVIALAGLLYFLWSAPMFRVTAPEINGLQRLTQADMDTVIGVSDDSIFSIDPTRIHQDLQQAFPEAAAITVEVKLPAALVVTVDERIPVLSWTKDGKETWVDADGTLFPPRGSADGLVIVDGNLPTVMSTDGKTALRLAAPGIVSAIKQMSILAPKKSRLIYDAEHGLGWSDKKGLKVFFGMDSNNMPLKLQIYLSLVKRLSEEGVRPSMISLEYMNAPYYKVERSEN